MSGRPSIRFVMGRIVWPRPDGIALRQYAVLRALARIGPVDLVCRAAPDEADRPEEWVRLCRRFVVQPDAGMRNDGPAGPWRRAGTLLAQLLGRPASADRLADHAVLPDVREILNQRYDLTWIVRLGNFWRFGLTGGPRCVLDLDDVKHRELLRPTYAREFSLKARLGRSIEGRAWRRAELAAADRFGRVLVCSDLDRRYFDRPNVMALHNAVRVDPEPPFGPGTPGRMVFIGNMNFTPNIDGVQYFVRRILPLIRRAWPGAHLWIVGKDPVPAVRALDDGTAVRVVGSVPDTAPYLAEAQISVVPLRMGSGTRLKIMESLAAKTPVVATRVGAEGLDLADERHLFLADAPELFARRCVALLSDPALRQSLAQTGYEQVRRFYSWAYVETQVHRIVTGLLDDARPE